MGRGTLRTLAGAASTLPPAALRAGAVLLACAWTSGYPGSAVGQEVENGAPADSAVVQGLVQDQETGRPVAGAAVTLEALGQEGGAEIRATDDGGRFRFRAVGPGAYAVGVTMLGYRGREDTLRVESNTEVELLLTLTASPVPLEPIVVEAVARPWRAPVLEAFDARRARLHGTFFDRAEIEQRNALRVSDLFLTVPNTRVSEGRLYNLRNAFIDRLCPMPFYVDGVPLVAGTDIDALFSPEAVEAVEVYTSLAQVPPQYGGLRNPCGAVLIWLRPGGGPPVPPRDPGRMWKGVAVLAGVLGGLWLLAR